MTDANNVAITPANQAALWRLDPNLPRDSKESRLLFIKNACVNYAAIARDIAAAVAVPAIPALNAVRQEASLLLTYYWISIKALLDNYNQSPNVHRTLGLAELRSIMHPFQVAILSISGAAVLPILVLPNGDLQFPNRDPTELLHTARWLAEPVATRPINLGQQQNRMITSRLAQLWLRNRSPRDGKEVYGAALPAIVFTCMGHAPELVVRNSCARWPGWRPMYRQGPIWRQFRFDDQNRRDTLFNAGQRAGTEFQQAINALNPALRLNMQALSVNVTLVQWNNLITTIATNLSAQPPNNQRAYAFGHGNETARSWRGFGPQIYTSQSRCWKCRFIHRYRVDEPPPPPLIPYENPISTPFAANPPLSCGEDLAHWRCSNIIIGTRPLVFPGGPPLVQ